MPVETPYSILTVIWLSGQVLMAVIGLMAWRRTLRGANTDEHNQLLFGVWGPIALIVPMLFSLSFIQSSIRGPGWLPMAAPIHIAWFALAVAAWRGMISFSRGIEPLIWSGAAVVMLLLGATHILTVLTGQLMFALAAVLLWMNTPPVGSSSHIKPNVTGDGTGGGAALFVTVLAAMGQGLFLLKAGEAMLPATGGITLFTAILMVRITEVNSGCESVVRLGGWAACYGLLLAVGILAMLHLFHMVFATIREHTIYPTGVAHGLGTYAIEAGALLLLGPIVLAMPRLNRSTQRILGAIVVVAAALATSYRLASI